MQNLFIKIDREVNDFSSIEEFNLEVSNLIMNFLIKFM